MTKIMSRIVPMTWNHFHLSMLVYLFHGLSVFVDATFGQFSKCIIRLLLFR
jgi:hypothetical protein